MSDLELPNGDVVESGDVILYEEYPYRVDLDDGIVLSPVYWGDSELDLEFESSDALAEQWGDESRGLLEPPEWEAWLSAARRDDRFGADELDAIEAAVLPSRGLLDRLRARLGLD